MRKSREHQFKKAKRDSSLSESDGSQSIFAAARMLNVSQEFLNTFNFEIMFRFVQGSLRGRCRRRSTRMRVRRA